MMVKQQLRHMVAPHPVDDAPPQRDSSRCRRRPPPLLPQVAPMVDQSELAFRQLCRRHGATAAYTPMLHARLFLEGPAYRAEHFTTTTGDRPLLAQFCANDPDILLAAARLVTPFVDGVDINLGCPQRIAKRGRYGACGGAERMVCVRVWGGGGGGGSSVALPPTDTAEWPTLPDSAHTSPPPPPPAPAGAYLMDDVDLVERMVAALATHLTVPVTVKIRRCADVAATVAYAARLEAAGASLLAIHGRTREQKRASEVRAEWEHIRAVKQVGVRRGTGGGRSRGVHAQMVVVGERCIAPCPSCPCPPFPPPPPTHIPVALRIPAGRRCASP